MSQSNLIKGRWPIWLGSISLLSGVVFFGQHFANYFIFIWILLLVCTLSWGVFLKRFWIKQLFFSLSAVFFVLALFEFYWGGIAFHCHQNMQANGKEWNAPAGCSYIWGQGITKDSTVVFDASNRQQSFYLLTDIIKVWGFKFRPLTYYYRLMTDPLGVVFKNVVHINQRGERVVVPTSSCSKQKKIWVLGGSFVFGEGVMDNETLPAQLQQELGEDYCVRNMGIPGNGLHQVLYQLEHLEKAQDIDQIIIVTIPDHYYRAWGMRSWNRDQPCYKVRDGKLVLAGTFDQCQNFFIRWPKGSVIFHKIISKVHTAKQDQIMQFLIQKLEDISTKKFHAKLTIFVSSQLGYDFGNLFLSFMHRPGIEAYSFLDLQLDAEDKKKIFIPRNLHPTMFLNSKIAKFIASKRLK